MRYCRSLSAAGDVPAPIVVQRFAEVLDAPVAQEVHHVVTDAPLPPTAPPEAAVGADLPPAPPPVPVGPQGNVMVAQRGTGRVQRHRPE